MLLKKAPQKHKKYLQANLDEHREDLANFYAVNRNLFQFVLGYIQSLIIHPLRNFSEYQNTYYRFKHGVKGLLKGN